MRIFKDNKEITKQIQRLDNDIYYMDYLVGDYLYFASDFPFNHLYFKIGDANGIAATMKLEYYTTSWTECVELRDETNSFVTSGYVEFTPNRNFGWAQTVDSSQAGVSTVVYNKYWTRISFNVDLTAEIQLSFIGNKFSEDEDLFSEFPIFNDSNFLSAFQVGKISWEEQHIKAAELIIQDLQKKAVIIGAEQILDKRKFLGASVCKVAEIIYSAFGNDYLEQRKIAKEEYSKRLDLSQYNVDLNGSGNLEPMEIQARTNWLSR